MLLVPTVGLPQHAEKAVNLGADVVIAQGGRVEVTPERRHDAARYPK